MRQYLFGVLILLLGQLCSEVYCDQNDQNGISKIDSGSSSTEEEYDSLKSVEEEFSGEDLLGSQLKFPDVDESLAYWQSIYGKEDVPEFEEPPSIDGDSIFMDLSEMTDDDLEESEIVESPLVRQKRSSNLEEGSEIENGKIRDPRSSVSHTVSISKKEQRKSSRSSKTSRKSESRSSRRTTTCAAGTDSVIDSKRRLIQEKKDLIDAVVSGASQSEIADAVQHTLEAKQGLIDSLISAKADLLQGKSDLIHSHGAFNHDITLSQSEGSLGPILDAAQEALQAKQDLINVVVTGGSTAELANAVQHTMEAKKELIDSVISSKAELLQANDIHSHGGLDHRQRVFIDTRASGSLQSRDSIGHILDSAQGALEAKQDLINAAISGGSKAELAQAVQHTLEAKKELIDSVISSKAELLQPHDIHLHGRQRVFIDTGASGSLQSRDSLGHILDSAQGALEAKQDLINAAISGGSRAELAEAVQHTLEAKKELIDSVISSKAELLNRKDAIQSQGSLGQILDSAQEALGAKQNLINVAVSGGSTEELSGALEQTIRAKEELIDSVISDLIERKRNLINSHCRLHNRQDCTKCQESLNPILDSAQELLQKKKDLIDVVAARGTKAEFCDALHHTIGAKKDLIDTVISTKADIMQQKKDLINSQAGLEHGSSGSLGQIIDLKKKVLKEKKNLMDVALSGGSKSELAEAMVKTLDAKEDLIDSVTSNRAERILNKKEHSRYRAEGSCCGKSRHRESSRNTNSRFSTSFQSGSISSNRQFEGINSFPGGTAAEIAIEGGIEVETSLNKDINHHHSGSLILNNEVRSGVHISSDLQPGLVKKHVVIDSTSRSGEINLSNSGSIETSLNTDSQMNSQATNTRSGSISTHSGLAGTRSFHDSVAADLAIEGGIEVKTSLNKDINHHHAGSLILNNEIRSGAQTEQIEIASSSSSEEASLSYSGSIENSDSRINSQRTTNIQSGAMSTRSQLEGREFLLDQVEADVAIEGGIEVETSLHEGASHRHTGSLFVNNDIRSGVEISSDLNSRSQIEIDSSSSSKESSSSESMSMETSLDTDSRINSGISTQIQSGSISSHSQFDRTKSSSGGLAADIAIEGGIRIETSLDEETRHNHADSLIVDKEIRGSTTNQIEVDSSSGSDEIGSSDSESIETQAFFGGASSSESSSSESREISNEFGQISTGGESSVATQGALNVNGDLHSGIKSHGIGTTTAYQRSFDSGIDISQTTHIAAEGDDISSSFSAEIDRSNTERLLESEVAIDSGFDSSISSGVTVSRNSAFEDSGIQTGSSIGLRVSTESQIEVPDVAIHKGCSSGECGVTGKLYVGSDEVGQNNRHQHEGGVRIDLEKTLTIDHGMIDEIPEAENDHLITKSIEDIGQSDRSEDSRYFSADSVTDVHLNSETNIGVETSEQKSASATIHASKNVHIDVERDDDETTVYEEEAIEQELGGATISASSNVDIHVDSDNDVHTADKSSDIAVDLSGSSRAQITATKNLEALGGAASLNTDFPATIDLGDIEDNRNRHYHTTTYDEFGRGYSTAGHHRQGSQGQCLYFADNADYFDADRIFSNAQYRLTNSDDNCTGINAALNPECQRLNTVLWQSRDSGAPITLRTVKTYLSHGQELASEMQNRAQWLCNKGLIPKRHTPAMLHLINNFASQSTVEINLESEYSLFGTKLLQRRLSSEFHVTANTFVEFLRHHSFRIIEDEEDVIRPKRCPADDIYRSFDGSCNNQEHPTWGQCNTAFSRLLPARYHDGIHEIPKSVTGRELPNARAVSVHCFSRKDIPDRRLTLAVAQFAQLVSHDLGMQTIDQTVQGGIQCCADGNRPLPKNLQHHSCLPIEISKDDKFYSKFGSSCMNFVRSMTICREDGTLGQAEQLNTVTSYLDASPVYGSNKETCDGLRAFRGGRMKVSVRRGRELLPSVTNASRFCDVMSPNEVCYLAGDIRVNQNPQMAILQTLFLREHNSIADRLAEMNPHWDDERVFQETRRIVIAEYQCITYNEWLPLVIGEKYCRTHRLTPRFMDKMSRDYNPRVKAATINAFSTGAFRVFHSMVDGQVNLCPASREISHTLRLSNHYFRPQIIEQYDNLDDLIRGLVTQAMNAADKNFNPEITEYLFRSRNEFGLDLEALDIQRARDHGISGYNRFRELCGLRKAECFEDLIEEIPYESIATLQRIYEDVNDIDLIVGAALERRAPGCAVGPTARCLIGEQFYRCRVGDRFFYNNAGHDHSFTRAQFEEISKASFARLLCNTGDNIEEIQFDAFRTISRDNPLEYCCALGKLDLSAWKESKFDYKE